jgi:DNA-binding transcriptional LysR family regulator
MRNVTLKQLRALAGVARTGSVTGAARALHVTPPAITMQIQALEGLLGVALLDRLGDRFVLTDIGREVIEAVEHIETALDSCAASIAMAKGLESGQVSVGIVSTAKYFAPHALAAFARKHPGIDLRLVVGNREEIIQHLKANIIDMAVMGRPPVELAVDQYVMGDHPHVMIAPIDHPFAGRRNLAPTDFAGEVFLVRERGSGTRALMERFFARANVDPTIRMEIGSNETVKQAVMAGLGLSFISAHTVAAEIEDRRLVLLDVEGLPVVRQWYVVKLSDKRLSPAAAAITKFLSENGAEFLPVVPAPRS